MNNGSKKPVWQMVKEAVQQMNGECTYPAIVIRLMYGDDVNDSSMTCSIISGAVNHPSRIHYNENKKPRISDTPYDYLFNTGRGKAAWYDPEKHGVWEIAKATDGDLMVRLADGVEKLDVGRRNQRSDGRRARHVRARSAPVDYLARNLPKLPGHTASLDSLPHRRP